MAIYSYKLNMVMILINIRLIANNNTHPVKTFEFCLRCLCVRMRRVPQTLILPGFA